MMVATGTSASGPQTTSLLAAYRGLVCDLDGVVYRGAAEVPYAVPVLTAASGTHSVVYATNNASRPPADVAHQLAGFGLKVGVDQVVTSSQAGADHLVDVLPPGARVLAVGGSGVRLALEAVGLTVVTPDELGDGAEPVQAVLQGYGPHVRAVDLAEASYAVEAGAVWVATNCDATLPTERGMAPGNGMLVAAVVRAAGREPVVVGKPEAPLYTSCVRRLGLTPGEVLAVGDRLDTDILGAMAAGLDSLWVLTGADDLHSLAVATGSPRPTYVAPDLRALEHPLPLVTRSGDGWVCGGVRVSVVDGVSIRSSDDDETGAGGTPAARGAEAPDRRAALLTAGVHALCDARDRASSQPVDAGSVAASLTSAVEWWGGGGGGQ